MGRRIPNVFINDLIIRTDIIDIINARVKLKKQGKNFCAKCPFHDEKIPSFTVSKEKQFYYCFGCGAHGNVIDFLMNYERFTFVETIEELATIHNLEIPYEGRNYSIEVECYQRRNLYQIMDNLRIFYQNSLKKVIADHARKYLKKRGLSKNIIDRFAIGYAPIKWREILNFSFEKSKNRQLMMKSGILMTDNQGRDYAYFRDRIVFPIRDRRGRVIAFGGRCISDNCMPKYLNSSETIIFHKSRHLYGLYEIEKNKVNLHRLLVVEGYIDVISLAQYNINYAVALLGTSVTSLQIQILFRITNNIIFCYDGDQAGHEAAWRTLETAAPYMNDGCQLNFIFLPNGEDPDSLVRKEGQTAFEERIEKARSFSNFLFNTLLSRIDLNAPEGNAKLASLSLSLISLVPGDLLRIQLRQMLCFKLGIFDDIQIEKLIQKKRKRKTSLSISQPKHTTMRILVGLLIQNPEFSLLIPSFESLNHIKYPGINLFMELVDICLSIPNLTTGQILEIYRNKKEIFAIEKLSIWNDITNKKIARKMFIDSLNHLFDLALEQRLSELISRSRIYGLTVLEREEVRTIIQARTHKWNMIDQISNI